MGYKYGIWLVYNQESFNTIHIGHFTICCFMDYLDAINLYDELKNCYGIHTTLSVIGNNPVFFPNNMYSNDNNNLYSWGYYGTSNIWNLYKKLTDKYTCDFSNEPHTTIEYSKNKDNLQLKKSYNFNLDCTIHVVDITDDNPYKWYIIL